MRMLAAFLLASISSAAIADEPAVMRLQMPSKIIFSNGEDGGGPVVTPNNPVEIVAETNYRQRVFQQLNLTVLANGAVATDTISVTGLPAGLIFTRTDNGAGTISGSRSEAIAASITIAVHHADGSVADTQQISLIISDVLDASLPSAEYNFAPDEEVLIEPTALNAIGSLVWSHSLAELPPGLAFDSATGAISGTPTELFDYPLVTLTAVDQFDLQSATTDPFSFSAAATCGTWAYYDGPAAISWNKMAYGSGRIVAVASDGTRRSATSIDGISWATGLMPTSSWLGITYGNDRFVAVANSGTTRVSFSSDGLDWWNGTGVPVSTWRSVAYGNGLFVAVADTGTTQVMTSPTGNTWTARTAASVSGWTSVTYGNGKFVAISTTGLVMTSPNGIDWTQTADLHNLSFVKFVGSMFYVSGGGMTMRSVDGVNWTAVTTEPYNWQDIAYGGGVYTMVAPGVRTTSTNGVTWSPVETIAESMTTRNIVFAGDRFVSLGASGTKRAQVQAGC